MRLARRLAAYGRVLRRGRRNRTDLVRRMGRRPALLAAIAGYEAAMLASNRVDLRLKSLALTKVAARTGCPF